MMNETRRDEIIYEEGWRDAEPMPSDDMPLDEQPHEERKSRIPGSLLILIQLIACAIFALVLFILRAMDSPAYHDFMVYYRTEMSKPVISQEFFDNSDVSRLLGGDVRLRSTSDEL